jgi:hypothetical protein
MHTPVQASSGLDVHDRKPAEADLSAGALLDLVMPELGLPRRFLALRKL